MLLRRVTSQLTRPANIHVCKQISVNNRPLVCVLSLASTAHRMDTIAGYMSTLPHFVTLMLNDNLKEGRIGGECSRTGRYEKVIIGKAEGKRPIGETCK